MVPQIRVKYRTKDFVKYTIEQFTGKQYRCLNCNSIFYSEREFFIHLNRCKKFEKNKHIKCPQLNDSIKSILLYTEDIRDDLKQKYFENQEKKKFKMNK